MLTCPVETGTLAELLHYLHHHPLPVRFVALEKRIYYMTLETSSAKYMDTIEKKIRRKKKLTKKVKGIRMRNEERLKKDKIHGKGPKGARKVPKYRRMAEV